MPWLGVAAVEVGALFAPHVAFLIAVVVAALFLLTRWSETADRSAYAMGALCALVAPIWSLVVIGHALVEDPLFWVVERAGASTLEWLLGWFLEAAAALLVAALLFFVWRPVWITGLFLRAPQGVVRRRFKSLESSWQLALGALVLLAVVHYVSVLLGAVP